MKKSSPFVQGTLILTAANIFSRFIGFYNRIFLAGLIGAHQMGVYQLIFPIYLVGFALCFHGYETALSQIVAAQMAKGRPENCRKILKITLAVTILLSVICACFFYFFADELCMKFLHEKDCIPCLKAAVFAMPFVGVKACIHSYHIGLGKPGLPSVSLCIEQVSRILGIYAVSVTFFLELETPALIAVLGMVAGEMASCRLSPFKDKAAKQRTAGGFLQKAFWQPAFPQLSADLQLPLHYTAAESGKYFNSDDADQVLLQSALFGRSIWYPDRNGDSLYQLSVQHHQLHLCDASAESISRDSGTGLPHITQGHQILPFLLLSAGDRKFLFIFYSGAIYRTDRIPQQRGRHVPEDALLFVSGALSFRNPVQYPERSWEDQNHAV